MNRSLTIFVPLLVSGALQQEARSADIELTIEVPRLDVGQYHRPYVAGWIEDTDSTHVADLTVWYDLEMKNGQGETWLKDLRQWWRKSGRSAKLPIDGVSGPTRPVGHHTVELPLSQIKLPPKEKGQYSLVVEAAREVGGRELVRIPFTWDGKNAVSVTGTGKTELGEIKLVVTPPQTK